MAIGERIHFFRNLRGMTQKYLGQLLGFSERTADVRVAQYESEARTPKKDTINAIAHYLDVSPVALNVPDIDTYIGLMHTMFALEDKYGFKVDEVNGEICLKVDTHKSTASIQLYEMFCAWYKCSTMLKTGEISQEEYNRWRYCYPEFDTTQHWVKVHSLEFSDMLIEELKEHTHNNH